MTRTYQNHRDRNPVGNQPPIDLPDSFESFGPPKPLTRSDVALLCSISIIGSFCTGFLAAALYYT